MRAHEDARRSAALLRSRGFRVVLAPAIRIRATGALPSGESFDAVAATSAKAIARLAPAAAAAIGGLPLFVVGARAARAAAERGLDVAGEPAADAGALSAVLRARLAPPARVLYLAGRDRKPALEAALGQAGLSTTILEVYRAEARQAWDEEEARALAGCEAALHYSRRSAALAVALAERAGIAERFRAMAQVCLSPDVAEPLRAAGWPRLVCADAPNETRLMAALERALVA
jgi:uroporphyrinogen-III synthase